MHSSHSALWRRVLGIASVAATTATVLVMALLMGSHTPLLIAEIRDTAQNRTGGWQSIHILGADCPCSARLARRLAQRGPQARRNERVIFVGEEPETERLLDESGWHVEKWTPQRVRQYYGVQGAPVLLVIDPEGAIRYSGGYSHRSDARDGYHDLEIWDALQQGRPVSRLPAYGCAFIFGCSWGPFKELTEIEAFK